MSLEKLFCVVFTYSVKRTREIREFHVAVLQRWLKNVRKKCDARAKLLFTNINVLPFLPFSFSLPSPSLLPKLPFVVIKKKLLPW